MNKKLPVDAIIAFIVELLVIITSIAVPVLRAKVWQSPILALKFYVTVILTGLWFVSLISEFISAFSCESDFGTPTDAIEQNNAVDQSDLTEEQKNRLSNGQLYNADKRVEAKKLSLDNKRNCFEITVKYAGVIGILWFNLGSWV